jgi:hypothetical protein
MAALLLALLLPLAQPEQAASVTPSGKVAREVTSPADVCSVSVSGASTASCLAAEFGSAGTVTGPLHLEVSDCCEACFGEAPAASIALIHRGACSFTVKAQHAFQAGASAVLIINKGNEPPMVMGATDKIVLNIPVGMVSQAEGMELAAHKGKKEKEGECNNACKAQKLQLRGRMRFINRLYH